MKIMFGLCHPKDVHFWKYIINNLKDNGHEVCILAWDKDLTKYLLDVYGFKYELIGKSYKNLFGKIFDLVRSDLKVYKIARNFKPDILIHGGPYLAHVSRVIKKPYIYFTDTEFSTIGQRITYPFSDAICTPSCFGKDIKSNKHIKVDGYFELAYLHPNYFKPNLSILKELGLSKNDKYIIIRFVAWGATHDIGQHGFTDKEKFVKSLEKYGRVFITSENKLNDNLEKYRLSVRPEKIHDLLYFATMYIGEGATMACEAAILGTPSIYINTLRLGYLDELEEKFGLVYNFSDPINGQNQALEKALELLEVDTLKEKWQEKRKRMLEGKIDVTKFYTNFIENFPLNYKNKKT